jgi:hypothetical protein
VISGLGPPKQRRTLRLIQDRQADARDMVGRRLEGGPMWGQFLLGVALGVLLAGIGWLAYLRGR